MKIIQIVGIPREHIEPMIMGLGDDGGIYQWEPTESKWKFWGNNKSLDFFRA